MEIRFLTVAEVMRLHERSINAFGGALGVRDMALLQSALAMPSAQFGGQYLHDDFPAMAGAYLYHLCMNHPFLDGNKRTAALAARVFLMVNDVAFDPPEEQFTEVVLRLAAGSMSKSEVTEFVRRYAVVA